MDADVVRIGALRWPVTISQRNQAAERSGMKIVETFSRSQEVFAKVEAVAPLTFYVAQQTDLATTHRITIRWLDWVDATCVIFRTLKRADGTLRAERFRVHRTTEVDGRQRFLQMECELEARQ